VPELNWEELLRDPVVWAGAGGAVVVLVLIVVLFSRRGRGPRGRVVDDSRAQARKRLLGELRAFRDGVGRATAAAEPVFRKIDGGTLHADVIGHWRREAKHRIQVRSPNLNDLKGVARLLDYDAMPISDLEAAWRKLDRQIQAWNSGGLDSDKTPIATVRVLEKDLQKIVVLANICITKYA
jgi:hypothetical protein